MLPLLKLEQNVGSDKSWVWTTPFDYAEETPKKEVFAIRFGTVEKANQFKEEFEKAQAINKDIIEKNSEKAE